MQSLVFDGKLPRRRPQFSSHPEFAFRMAVLFSIALHLVLLSLWKAPHPAIVLRSNPVFTVSLVPAENAAHTKPDRQAAFAPERLKPVRQKPLTEPKPLAENQQAIELAVPSKPEQISEHAANNSVLDIQQSLPDKNLQSTPSNPAITNDQSDSARKVDVLLLIGGDGRVQQIIWNQLPALTEQALSEMENSLRGKTYLAKGKPYTTTETVEIARDSH